MTASTCVPRVRAETVADRDGVERVLRLAFGREDEAFLVLELAPGALEGVEGVVVYAEPFGV